MSLHVAVTGTQLGPPSGANRRLLQLVQCAAPLLAGDERITVLHGADFVPPPPLPRVAWHAVAIPRGPVLRRAIAERRALPRLLQQLGVTVLDHGLLPAPRVPCALVQTIHDLRDVDGHGRWPRWLARVVVRAAAARAAIVVVPSEFTRQRLRAIARAAAIAIIGNGVDPAPAAAPAPAGPLLHVGHLEPRKNLGVLLRALARLPAARRPELVLAGADAGSGPELRALAQRLGLLAHVRFLGAVDDVELQRLYGTARAVAVPSRCEGFGMCALEALAHGRPLLAAAAGALPEVAGDQAVLLPPDDDAAWAAAIAATADDRGDAAARRARAARCSWPLAAAKLVEVWRAAALRT